MKELLGTAFHGTPSSISKEISQNHSVKYNFAVSVKRSDSKKRKMIIQCVHGGQYRNTHNVTQATRRRKRDTNKTGCPWIMVLKLTRQDATDLKHPSLQGTWKVTRVGDMDEHKHNDNDDIKPLGYYHVHRQPTLHIEQQIKNMTEHAIRPSKIRQKIRVDDDDMIMTMRDIYNFRAKIFKEDKNGEFTKLMKLLMTEGFATMYKVSDERLDAIFFSHEYGQEQARKFPEIAILDATYKTTTTKMPLINIVGVSNLGGRRLRVIFASAFVSNEKYESYEWVMKMARKVLWPDGDIGMFITDNEAALVKAISNVFPDSKHMLCAWHIEQHLRTNLGNCFPPKCDEIKEVNKVLKSMLYGSETQDDFNKSVAAYRYLIGKAAVAFAKDNLKDSESQQAKTSKNGKLDQPKGSSDGMDDQGQNEEVIEETEDGQDQDQGRGQPAESRNCESTPDNGVKDVDDGKGYEELSRLANKKKEKMTNYFERYDQYRDGFFFI